MTKTGFGFIIAAGFIYLVAGQTQIGWLYLFDAILWSLLLISAILPWYSLRSLEVERQILLPPTTLSQWQLGGPLEDETVEVKLKISNHGRLAKHFIKIGEDCPFDKPEKRHKAFFILYLKPRSVTDFIYTANCYRRGHYPSANITLQSSGPLGLIVRHRTFALPLNLTIYPSYYQMEGLPATEATWAETGHAIRSSAADQFYGSREYQYGDPLKYIHWRHTARLGRFILKEFEEPSQGSVRVFFETNRNFGREKETTLEYSIKIAASLAKLCTDSGRSLDIITGRKPLLNAGWREAMDYLAYLEAGGKPALAELSTAPGQVIVAIVPAAATELVSTLTQLASKAQGLVVVLLEGFAPDEMLAQLQTRWTEGNLHIVSCPRGNLESSLKRLSDALLGISQSAAFLG